jgi:hypothetical protein
MDVNGCASLQTQIAFRQQGARVFRGPGTVPNVRHHELAPQDGVPGEVVLHSGIEHWRGVWESLIRLLAYRKDADTDAFIIAMIQWLGHLKDEVTYADTLMRQGDGWRARRILSRFERSLKSYNSLFRPHSTCGCMDAARFLESRTRLMQGILIAAQRGQPVRLVAGVRSSEFEDLMDRVQGAECWQEGSAMLSSLVTLIAPDVAPGTEAAFGWNASPGGWPPRPANALDVGHSADASTTSRR